MKHNLIRKIEKTFLGYSGDYDSITKKNRCAFDWLVDSTEVWEWVKFKIENNLTNLTKRDFNKWIIWSQEEATIPIINPKKSKEVLKKTLFAIEDLSEKRSKA